MIDGIRYKIPPSEFKAWSEITGNNLHPEETKILHEMDTEFSTIINEEAEAFRERERERLKNENKGKK